ncbi:copper chaperone PCu(A)C [Paracoccus sp. PS-1]|uniref:copper chaperone PCu(A)C n=1 Tax=unclassified Paracoccus (in: a-proteobacteria) TaxID=2688777 RepID=UPI0004B9E280|nr:MULTISPECIES: copper chaperone PCu(A)C [unclassified Paracoccus (in: a-proteobacteria)]MDQ7260362.1 copper chaperone PCu(A)C [Paracoccus sp. PS1]
MKPLLPALCLALLPPAAMAQDLVLRDGYARAANPRSAAAFMVIQNRGAAPCTLSAVASDAAERVALHTHREESGVMRMAEAGPIEIPAGGSHPLARGGDHVMLMGLKRPLQDGDTLVLMLDFGGCGTIDARLPVDNGRMPGHGAMAH